MRTTAQKFAHWRRISIVAASLMIGFLLAFIGVVFVLPILAHASWHLYRKAPKKISKRRQIGFSPSR
jgi:uncharacterized membrane protein